MKKLHPAIKVAKKILAKHGVDIFPTGSALSAQVVTPYIRGVYDSRPIVIDLQISSNDDTAKLAICWLYEDHSDYARIKSITDNLVISF